MASTNPAPPPAWDEATVAALIDELWALRRAMLAHEQRLAPWLQAVAPARRASAVNLAHYLALRRHELRELQDRLARLGLSSLGRSETHALANLDKVLGLLHRVAGRPWQPLEDEEPSGYARGPALLAQHAKALLGPAPGGRAVRIMVTLPSEAAQDEALVARMVDAGMNVARINCAHDDAVAWAAMATHVRRAARAAGRSVKVLMDLGGPKLRTGALADGPALLKLQPQRDALGRVLAPWRLGLHDVGQPQALQGVTHSLGLQAEWLARLRSGHELRLVDARGALRHLRVVQRQAQGVVVECEHTAYLVPETELHWHGHRRHASAGRLVGLPVQPGQLLLQRGDHLVLAASGLGQPAAAGRPARIACTLPQVLAQMQPGQPVWFDDGRIGGVVLRASRRQALVRITDAREGGDKLAADKGINLPDTALQLPALSPQDLQDLECAARHADIVGLSFAQGAEDVHALRARLAELGVPHLALMLKIETRRGFEHLPELLLAALRGPAAGVMIARGDLAVELGWERLAEVQEEILWACEAAHMPVVWATQVLETLAKTGQPSRAEITDAAMGARAECVMLNKGPHVAEAIAALDDILRRMQAHQAKKRPLLRALKSWALGAAPR